MSESGSLKRSERFNKPDADITFKSSDGVLFALHKNNLSSLSDAFPRDLLSPQAIDLPEDSETLELLFRFVYPEDGVPDVLDTSFPLTMKVLRTAEKYGMHFAISFWKMRMRFIVRRMYHPNSLQDVYPATTEDLKLVVRHAMTHVGYTEILDEAALLLAVSERLASSIDAFPVEHQITWALYQDKWISLHAYAVDSVSSQMQACHMGGCPSYKTIAALKLDVSLLKLKDNESILCTKFYARYKIHQKFDEIKKFSVFCEEMSNKTGSY